MAKNDEAKRLIIEKIKAALGDAYIGEEAKKYYFWSTENGEKVQVAISLTCPKTPIGTLDMTNAFSDGYDFSGTATTVVKPEPVVEVTEEEKENIKALMERLGL